MSNLNFDSNNILSSYNFARLSDIVYAESLSVNQFHSLNIENYQVYSEDSHRVLYRKNTIDVSENNIIFCHTDFINHLFELLKNVPFKNIKLITSQSDTLVTKSIFQKKPECISKWFSINVGYKNEKLSPLPLGLANEYSKNLSLKEINFAKNKKINKLYLNFRENTSYKHRKNLYEIFSKYDWVVTKNPELSNSSYSNDLSIYKFVMCPWGNGIDTHRIWETLYSGSIPVVKRHNTFNTLDDLPIFFYDNLNDVTINNLLKFAQKNQTFDLNLLNINLWMNKISAFKLDSNLQNYKLEKNLNKFDEKLIRKQKNNSIKKKILYYLRKTIYLLIPSSWF